MFLAGFHRGPPVVSRKKRTRGLKKGRGRQRSSPDRRGNSGPSRALLAPRRKLHKDDRNSERSEQPPMRPSDCHLAKQTRRERSSAETRVASRNWRNDSNGFPRDPGKSFSPGNPVIPSTIVPYNLLQNENQEKQAYKNERKKKKKNLLGSVA